MASLAEHAGVALTRVFHFGPHRITDDGPCHVIAEVGNTHDGSLERARQLVIHTAASGCSGVKFQKKDVSSLYHPTMAMAPYGDGALTYGARKEALELRGEQLAVLRRQAQALGLVWFATPFDEASLAELLALGMSVVKVHSGAITDGPLLRAIARAGQSVILSTGASTLAIIDRAYGLLRAELPATAVAIMQCTAAYPTATADLQLRVIHTVHARYPEAIVGWSSHHASPRRSGITMAILAYGFGARLIETHLTLDRTLPGTDHAFSLEPKGLAKLVWTLHEAARAAGDGVKRPLPSEWPGIAKLRRLPPSWQITGDAHACERYTTSLGRGGGDSPDPDRDGQTPPPSGGDEGRPSVSLQS